jgi:hypothetical protein
MDESIRFLAENATRAELVDVLEKVEGARSGLYDVLERLLGGIRNHGLQNTLEPMVREALHDFDGSCLCDAVRDVDDRMQEVMEVSVSGPCREANMACRAIVEHLEKSLKTELPLDDVIRMVAVVNEAIDRSMKEAVRPLVRLAADVKEMAERTGRRASIVLEKMGDESITMSVRQVVENSRRISEAVDEAMSGIGGA